MSGPKTSRYTLTVEQRRRLEEQRQIEHRNTLSDDEYLKMLDEKLSEELQEYQESKSMEELADLLEVMMAVAIARGSSIEEIDRIRIAKAEKRGAFMQKILLTEVID